MSNRRREIGALRALDFRRSAILVAFVTESLLLSLLGGALGTALSALMELATFSTVNMATWSEVVFRFRLSPGIVVAALVFSSVIGVLGGLFPAVRAARMKIIDAVCA